MGNGGYDDRGVDGRALGKDARRRYACAFVTDIRRLGGLKIFSSSFLCALCFILNATLQTCALFSNILFYKKHPTPVRAPNANAFSERWVRTVREECLDYILIFNAAHLRRVVIEFVDYYNTARPHQGIDQQTPIPQARPSSGTIRCRNVLGGIIHDYYRAPTLLALPAT